MTQDVARPAPDVTQTGTEMLEALDESIYWPAVAATGLASFALSLSLQVRGVDEPQASAQR